MERVTEQMEADRMLRQYSEGVPLTLLSALRDVFHRREVPGTAARILRKARHAVGEERLSRRIRVDKQHSARADYRWHRRCGFSRRWCVALILERYGY